MFLIYLLVTAALANANDLFGTWTTKSRDVLTGPGFYDPLNDKLLEPNLTGISYSFDDDGNYESAYYRAISNPTDPSCPGGIMQWQHGAYTVFGNGSLVLTPIAVDGRQLLSDPCRKHSGQYTRYNTTEEFKGFTVDVDKFNRIKRLDLTRADGSVVNPMFLAYQPPKMLPTTTLNPMPTGNKRKRELLTSGSQLTAREQLINPDRWWWLGVLMTSLGGVAFFCS
ncbi:Chaperone endoplasmic reticulum protein-folding [Penicillium fimorum]|uniref:Protein ROT1 n=1 Tax=Penicillium fimorum TaxID=1882269 RepID=A0A9X0C4H3_9EURO|nr:Chaperone endoplasmic reticulum protein-folding [Penicillium fimorum]